MAEDLALTKRDWYKHISDHIEEKIIHLDSADRFLINESIDAVYIIIVIVLASQLHKLEKNSRQLILR